jgi:ADP-ribose pyrophosphatase YjhB (NUDIX family)
MWYSHPPIRIPISVRYTFRVIDKRLSEAEFKSIYARVPRLCVDLVVCTPEGIVLTLRTLPTWNGLWHLPGGTVFYKEPIVEAANRIALRELGVEIEIEKFLGYMEFPSEERERGFGWTVSLVLLCRMSGGALKKETDEASAIRAFTALPDPMVTEHRVFLLAHWDEIMKEKRS